MPKSYLRPRGPVYGLPVEYNDDLISDFAAWTLTNLDFVQERVRSGDKGLYNVTQLWNSHLCGT